MAEIKLPGDFVVNIDESQKPFLSKKGDYISTNVIGVQTNEHFNILKKSVVPKVHDIIIGRVIRVKRKEAHLVILTTNDIPLHSMLLAELRSVDIAAKDVDNQVASKFCQPGDLIKARVVALGRSGFYAQVSTAEEGLGVYKLTQEQKL
ncbi:hypothetical protein M9Y10_022822 [Tritrichomonas musculus]|uniref:S1 motif domain-containing protein n=1 Tax=Tritrichomonas musculus TaxID=1915356 RepID=A0ABR2KTZ0_9EUKA